MDYELAVAIIAAIFAGLAWRVSDKTLKLQEKGNRENQAANKELLRNFQRQYLLSMVSVLKDTYVQDVARTNAQEKLTESIGIFLNNNIEDREFHQLAKAAFPKHVIEKINDSEKFPAAKEMSARMKKMGIELVSLM
jgi:hypothetical protein